MSFNPQSAVKDIMDRSKGHLHEVGETYWDHMGFALHVLWMLLSASVLLVVHLLIPAFFQCSASKRILKINEEICARKGHRDGCPGQ